MIGVSGDGDSLSIGLGQLCHAIRRNVNMLYMLENNGVYGLTKGQFSASADPGSTAKKGEANTMQAIDFALLALGATFVARSFSGDKAQLVYDPTNRDAAYAHIREHQRKGEVITGLLYISPDSKDVHDQNETVTESLYNLPHAQLCPGNDALQKLQQQFR